MALKKEELFCEKYTKALGRAIAQKVEDGHTVKEICEILKPAGFPNEKTIYRWKKKYPEFKQILDMAYQDYFFKMMDEAELLSKESLRESTGKDRKEALKIRLKHIEFILNRIAPKLVNDLKDQHSANAMPITVTVVNYSTKDKTPLLIDHDPE